MAAAAIAATATCSVVLNPAATAAVDTASVAKRTECVVHSTQRRRSSENERQQQYRAPTHRKATGLRAAMTISTTLTAGSASQTAPRVEAVEEPARTTCTVRYREPATGENCNDATEFFTHFRHCARFAARLARVRARECRLASPTQLIDEQREGENTNVNAASLMMTAPLPLLLPPPLLPAKVTTATAAVAAALTGVQSSAFTYEITSVCTQRQRRGRTDRHHHLTLSSDRVHIANPDRTIITSYDGDNSSGSSTSSSRFIDHSERNARQGGGAARLPLASRPPYGGASSATCAPSPPAASWLCRLGPLVMALCALLCAGVQPVDADRNRYFHISTLCVGERTYPQYKVIHGAVLSSESENDLDCVITFQTDSILQKFMLRFEKLALDCNDHLVIFDGAHAIGKSKVDLSCRSTRSDVGTIFTQSNYVTLKYTTDSYSQQKNGFKLVITAYKDMNNPKHEALPCQQFSCGGPQHYCISQDLTCDGVNHCGDGSDEDERAHCVDDSAGHQIMGIGVSVFLTLLLIAFTFCLLCIAAIVFCVCRQGPRDYAPSQVALQNGRPMMNGGPNSMMGPTMQNTTITPFGTYPGKGPGDEILSLQPGSHSTFPLRAPLNPNGKPVNQSASGENWLV